jgi:hypothetical protein
MTAGIAGKPHAHTPAEFDAPAWDLERLRAHLADMHNLTLPAGDKLHGVPAVQALAAIHAAEHPEAAGIVTGDRLPR